MVTIFKKGIFMNVEEFDKHGNKILEGMNVIIYQKEEIFYNEQPFKDDNEALEMAKLTTNMYDDGSIYEYKLVKDSKDLYTLYKDGKPYGMTIPEVTLERSPFYMDSENNIPEIGVEKGDKVLVFGFEGAAVGVCRYPAEALEIKK